MKINKVRLIDFLMLFVQSSTAMMAFNLINTNNDSFPQKYRDSVICASTLFANILRNEDNDLFERKINYISILPINHKLSDTKFVKPTAYNFTSGFFELEIDKVTGEEHKVPIAGILHVVLETD